MIFEARELGCKRGGLELFSGVGASLRAGEALRVAGCNGAGKSSLLRILCGLATPDAGEVMWNERCIRRGGEDFRRQLLYMGHAPGIKGDLLAWENLAMAAMLDGMKIDFDQALAALNGMGLGHAAELPARSLSQGQRKRVALARLHFSSGRPLWILDEPFTALDADAIATLSAFVNRHLGAGGMLIYTTHQEVGIEARRHHLLQLSGPPQC
jgi:heme exporter protein A